jgi:hypothetical protein
MPRTGNAHAEGRVMAIERTGARVPDSGCVALTSGIARQTLSHTQEAFWIEWPLMRHERHLEDRLPEAAMRV